MYTPNVTVHVHVYADVHVYVDLHVRVLCSCSLALHLCTPCPVDLTVHVYWTSNEPTLYYVQSRLRKSHSTYARHRE